MSLLGSQVYANPNTPCWVAAGNGEVGNLIVNGTLTTEGSVNLNLGNGNYVMSLNDATGTIQYAQIFAGSANGGRLYVNAPGDIYFGRPGSGNSANTSLTLSAAGSGLDVLTVGGKVQAQALGLGTGASGTGAITVGTSNVTIASTKVTATSQIFLSHVGAPSAGPGAGAAQGNLTYRVADIVPNVSFTVYLTDITGVSIAASNVDATFVWMVVN